MMRLPWLILALGVGCKTEPSDKQRDAQDASTPDTEDPSDDNCITDEEFFADAAAPVLESCTICHQANGIAAETRHVLVPFSEPDALTENFARLRTFVTETADGAELMLQKPTGEATHGGGTRFSNLDPQYAILDELVARYQQPGGCDHPGELAEGCVPGEVYGGATTPRRLTDLQFRNAVWDLLGVEADGSLRPDTVRSADFRTWATSNPVTSAGAELILLSAETIAARTDLSTVLRCDPLDAACVEPALLSLAERFYRRPLTEDEATILRAAFSDAADVTAGAQMVISVLLQSPQFLYIDLIPPVEEDTVLDDYAIASRLSFFLANTTPDDALLTAAAADELHTRAQVAVHAERLLQDPRIVQAVIGFHEDWLDIHRLEGAERDLATYPDFTPETFESMRLELDLYVAEVLWSGDGRFDTLMFSDVTWVDANLAPIYGVPTPPEGQWARITLDADQRPGLLTRTAFLASHAHAAASAPVQRGAFMLEEMLCEELTPPPGIDTELPDESAEAPTIRERLQGHLTDSTCASCHVKMDPLGLSFEHYGALGEWRDAWRNGIPVDATGALDDPAGDFDGAAEMIALIAASPRAKGCYVERWFEYALGRAAENADTCSLNILKSRFIETDGDMRRLLIDVALTDAFRVQSSEEE